MAPNAETMIPGPNGKTLDTYGDINDACQLLTEFQEIGNRIGKNLNITNWVHTVDHFGAIRDVRRRVYASLHTGKYDDNDTFRLQEFNSTLGPKGDWKPTHSARGHPRVIANGKGRSVRADTAGDVPASTAEEGGPWTARGYGQSSTAAGPRY